MRARRCSGGERDVERRSFPLVQSALANRACSGIVRILMRREVKHRRVAIENLLSAVSVMNIPIDYQDSIRSVVHLRVASGDGGVVEETESHRPARSRVMTRRPDQRDGIRGVVEDLIDGDGCGSRGESCDVE